MEKMRNSILIRAAFEDDLPEVLSLYSQLGMDDGTVLSLDVAKQIFARMKTYPDYTLYVSVAGGKVVGAFALLVMDNIGHQGTPSGVVEDVIVHEDWRGRGVGRMMMEEAMSMCAAKCCYKLALTSNKNRHNAHRFYETLGFDLHGFSYSVQLERRGQTAGPHNNIESGASSCE
jgi:ribosomal protein S18 acetylase RimI-like enzyme